ncbi:MAG: pilus assembly protein PilM [Deltaproteobacteria bacterium]|nr:pilus assembly protein PilM [Deltaproteobacteria bacterium]MBI3293833.1 pilus assembly protein PilM [Deltaproteobacteria bacterium]
MRILGIEFGSWSVKAVEMESRFRRFDVLELHEVRLPLTVTDPTATYKKAVQELMARLPSHPEKIVTSLLPAQTSVRVLNLPVRQIKKAEQMFKFELEDSTPFRLDDSITEHQSHKTKDGCTVFTAIAPKRHIQSQIEWLKAIGAEPDWLTFDGMGLINLYLSQEQKDEEIPAPSMILDIGHQKTNLCILEGGRVTYFRSIPWGGFQITQGLSNALGVPLEVAEKLKHEKLHLNAQIESAGISRELFSAAATSLASFLADINHTLYAFRTQYKKDVQKGLICGGCAATQGMVHYISRQLDRSIELFTPRIEIKQKDETTAIDTIQFGEAHGRALVFGHKAPLLFNFRRGELSKATSLNEVGNVFENPAIRKMVTYASLFFVALFLYASAAKVIAGNDARKSSDELKKVLQDTLKTIPAKQKNTLSSNPEDLKKYIEQKNKELEDRLKMVGRAAPPMLAIVKSISDAFAGEVKVDVNTLVIDDRSLVLEGVLYQGSLDQTTTNLQKSPFFSGVGITMNGQRFTYRGSVKGR